MAARARYALAGVVLFGCGGAASSDHLDHERIAAASSSIVGGTASSASGDAVVFVVPMTRVSVDGAEATKGCGGVLVAPNLVLTAKHCVYDYAANSKSICDASGEPQLGSDGGYVTGSFPVGDIAIFTGIDARKQFVDTKPPAARGRQIIDDETPTLCSHDLAYVVLDQPIVDKPIGRLRLGARPTAGPLDTITLSGWGEMEYRQRGTERMQRSGIPIQRVGPPEPPLNAAGSLGPRSFETGPGGANGDSGGPAADDRTGAVLGVLARALFADYADPVSPFRSDSVVNVYMTVVDFPTPLRTAFAAAGAEPWLEGRDAAGYRRFGEACASDLECEGNLCEGASTGVAGRCNADCHVPHHACPDGFACTAGRCAVASAAPAPELDAGATPPPAEPVSYRLAGGCSNTPNRGNPAPVGAALAACALLTRRIRMRHR